MVEKCGKSSALFIKGENLQSLFMVGVSAWRWGTATYESLLADLINCVGVMPHTFLNARTKLE